MDFKSIAILLFLGLLAFLGFWIYYFIKQLEFVLRAINLYEQMVRRQDMTVKLLKEIRDGFSGKTQQSKPNEKVDYSKVKKDETNTNEKMLMKSGQHHWGANYEVNDLEQRCPECGDVFHGEGFSSCDRCGSQLAAMPTKNWTM